MKVGGKAASVTRVDKTNDLALLRASADDPAHGIAKLRVTRPRLGEPVNAAGFPLHGLLVELNFTQGNVSSLSGLSGDTKLIQITAPVQPGNSGGPLLDADGNVLGVVVSKLNALELSKFTGDVAQNINFAINLGVLQSFLDASNVGFLSASRSNSGAIQPTSPVVVADLAKSITALVECE